ncbi:MAG TPA: four helix bundle protein [Candidatus Omnitrophica bacterium]|nr:four helix bundle protein [Candidatus Omnitrophota bacterium]
MQLQDSLNYKKLKVWQKAHENALRAIELYRNSSCRKFENIFKQFINAITSIGANIAEGIGDFKGREFIRFF